ncbi:MAG: phenylalanine--tRNA ligase subunit alpha [Acholeplasmataceae bacterium]|nr:phenylalanine--tRNA ligase subunit alpha [Acholeplasmataceae bacterium]
MKELLKQIKTEALFEIEQATTIGALEAVRVGYFGKKGRLTEVMGQMRHLDPAERPAFGQAVNTIKVAIEAAWTARKQNLEEAILIATLQKEQLDVTLPGLHLYQGSIHPLNQVIEEVEDLFLGMGYTVEEGPEVELDLFNFEMMNIAKDHPARDMQDSFYIDDKTLLRTQTSPVQARAMLKMKGEPLKIICPGKVYRKDDDDPSHSHQFMQIEGLVIDRDITLAHLKDTLLTMVRHLFGPEREIRLRPSYFPFTEPSMEVDVLMQKQDGTTEYIEILGAGMVHPEVLRMGGYDPQVYRGFAFGVGVERIALLKYHIDDIRHFYTNDIRFLRQFKEGVSS